MKLKYLILLAALSFFSGSTFATEYIYRDLMANTLASPNCAAEPEAIAEASKPFNLSKYSKRFCQSQGYGWHVEKIKDNGKAICTECTDAKSGKKQFIPCSAIVPTYSKRIEYRYHRGIRVSG